MQNKKILGIIGGMGPLATVHFFQKLVELTPAKEDQDHPRILIDNNPKIPDRTGAIFGKNPSPVPLIVETVQNLFKAGADVLAMPCVTAHFFFDEIQKEVDIPIIHMIRETKKRYTSSYSGKKIGLLSTDGTRKAKIFQSEFSPYPFIIPDEDTQKEFVMKAIYGKTGVKSGKTHAAKSLILRACRKLIDDGAEVLLSGCTEIPVILNPQDVAVPLLDPIQILAEVCLEQISS